MFKLKKMAILGIVCSTCYASGIVYFDQGQVMAKSTVLTSAQKKINTKYDAQLNGLLKEQSQLKKALDDADGNNLVMEHLAAQSLQLQEQIESINLERATKVQEYQVKYVTVEQGVLTKLLKDKKYDYILSSNAIYMTESSNDITAQVVKLTDKAYQNQK